MRAVVQRVAQAHVTVDDQMVGQIGQGLMVLLGIARSDTAVQVKWLAQKITGLRIFSDSSGQLRWDLKAVDGSLLVVSQFTLYGDVRRGFRPDFGRAAPREMAEDLYEQFLGECRELGCRVETGQFGSHMQVSLVNIGPVTIHIDTDEVMTGGVRGVSKA